MTIAGDGLIAAPMELLEPPHTGYEPIRVIQFDRGERSGVTQHNSLIAHDGVMVLVFWATYQARAAKTMPNKNTVLTVRPEITVTEVERHIWHTRTTKQPLLCQLKGNRQMMAASGNAQVTTAREPSSPIPAPLIAGQSPTDGIRTRLTELQRVRESPLSQFVLGVVTNHTDPRHGGSDRQRARRFHCRCGRSARDFADHELRTVGDGTGTRPNNHH